MAGWRNGSDTASAAGGLGSIPAPVKSVTESPTARQRCAIFSKFEAVPPRL